METPLTPLDFKRRTGRLHPNRLAVVDGDVRLSYQEFFDRCDRATAALANLGIQPGDRVVVIAPNTHANLEAYYAVPQLGAILVPVNYRLLAADFSYIIQHCGARAVLVDGEYVDAVNSIRSNLPQVAHWIVLDGSHPDWTSYETLLAAAPVKFEPPALRETDLITINYTSGTTARPKGVMITHRNAWMNCVGTLVHIAPQIGTPYLWTLPMFHANGWTFVWTVTAFAGVHVCLRKVEAGRVFDMVRTERIRLMCAAPTILMGLASAPARERQDVPTGVQVITAGAPPAATTIEQLEDGLGWDVLQMYGLTETSPFISLCEPRPEHQHLDTGSRAVIKARQGVELITSGDLRVWDEAGQDVPWDGATVGQIVVRGNTVMAGYYRDPDATALAMGDGWFRSGDAAVLHSDGYMEIRDRLKDVIISGGENISSVEVEGVMLRHPAVRDVAVVGFPDARWGETPHAFVVVQTDASVTAVDLIEFARAHLAHFKAPHFVHFVDSLPRTATGKLQKYMLRQGAAAIGKQ